MRTKTPASVSVVVNVGKESKKRRKVTRKRKPRTLAPGQLPPVRGIYDNANERALHFSNFPAHRVIHESMPAPPVATQAPVQQWFMNPPEFQGSPMIKAQGIEELGSALPNPNFFEPKREYTVGAAPQREGLGAELPHSPETFTVTQNPAFERRDYNLRQNPNRPNKFTPSAYK